MKAVKVEMGVVPDCFHGFRKPFFPNDLGKCLVVTHRVSPKERA